MTVSFTVREQTVQEMWRRTARGALELGEVRFTEYGAPRPTFQELEVTGVTSIYEHEDSFDGKTTLKNVVDLEFRIASGRDEGVRFRQPWINVTFGKKAILGGIWRAAGLPSPKPGENLELTDLIGRRFMAKLKSKPSNDGRGAWTSLVNETFEAVEPEEGSQPALTSSPAPARRTPPKATVEEPEDPWAGEEEPTFD